MDTLPLPPIPALTVALKPLAILSSVLLAAGCGASENPDRGEDEGGGVTATRAGPLAGLTLPDLDGVERPLRTRADEITVVNFWATWCLPCLDELPELVALDRRWAEDRVRVVGVAVESGAAADIRAFADEQGMEYTLLTADQRWGRKHFGVFGLPVTLVVDRSGEVRHTLIGPQTKTDFEAAVAPLLEPGEG
ncbi:MAG: TlpA disulfide reductase family protein [Gemmatimonadota bacterium]|nr:TlpA disulfide reductase family protein [Gemmatimonadota bacterium]